MEGTGIIVAGVILIHKLYAWRLPRTPPLSRTITVKRTASVKSIDVEEVLTGDIIQIESGSTVPCDCILVSGGVLEVDETAISGDK